MWTESLYGSSSVDMWEIKVIVGNGFYVFSIGRKICWKMKYRHC